MMKNEFKVFTITGHSGAGKDTLLNSFGIEQAVSHTTRSPRKGEVAGVNYHYVSTDEFQAIKENGEFAETIEYIPGKLYGVTKEAITKVGEKNGFVFIVCDEEGAGQIKEAYPEAIQFFIYTTREEMEQNMIDRGDTEESIQDRMNKYDKEILGKEKFPHLIENKRGQFEATQQNFIKQMKTFGIDLELPSEKEPTQKEIDETIEAAQEFLGLTVMHFDLNN